MRQRVAKDVAGIRAEYVLQSEIRSFEARYDHGDAPPVIVVDVALRLLAVQSGTIVAAREFRSRRASANSIAAAVAAFDMAVSVELAEIVRWIGEIAPSR